MWNRCDGSSWFVYTEIVMFEYCLWYIVKMHVVSSYMSHFCHFWGFLTSRAKGWIRVNLELLLKLTAQILPLGPRPGQVRVCWGCLLNMWAWCVVWSEVFLLKAVYVYYLLIGVVRQSTDCCSVLSNWKVQVLDSHTKYSLVLCSFACHPCWLFLPPDIADLANGGVAMMQETVVA